MPLSKHFGRVEWFAILIVLPVMIYLHYRAWILAFTYDECWSFLGYASSDVWSVMTNANPAANNHILHSLAMKLAAGLFGSSEYALRLPVLMSFLGYAYFAFKASRKLLDRYWWMAFIVLVYQPYLLDYFVTARGYGMAIMAMMGMLHSLSAFASKGKRSSLYWGLAWSVIGAYSNFTFMLVMIAGWVGVGLIGWQKGEWKRVILPLLTTIALACLFFIYPVWQLIQAKELYYGGDQGFFADTLLSLAGHALYLRFEGIYLAALFAMLIVVSFGRVILEIGKRSIGHVGFWHALVLVLGAIGSILQHHLIGSLFLIDRTALLFLPLLLTSFLWLISTIDLDAWRNRLVLMVAVASVANLGANFNTSHQLDFKEFADMDEAIAMIDRDAMPDDRFHLGKSVYMNAPIMYYKRRLEVAQILPAGLEFCDELGPTPYFYLFSKDTACVEDKSVALWRHFPVSNTFLYRRVAK